MKWTRVRCGCRGLWIVLHFSYKILFIKLVFGDLSPLERPWKHEWENQLESYLRLGGKCSSSDEIVRNLGDRQDTNQL